MSEDGISNSVEMAHFLGEILRKATPANLSEDELLLALPELFIDVAKLWYSAMHDECTCWQDFYNDAVSRFGAGSDFQQKLESELLNRTQGEDEEVRTYMFKLLAKAKKFQPAISERRKLDVLYENLKPQIKE